mmetsp:Transcript_5173/g.19390  ORF Transcript_5173/g.19390 Transcript_5173/m.19390 type:complete len:245 (+) Transcript_5173:987-1721(+)
MLVGHLPPLIEVGADHGPGLVTRAFQRCQGSQPSLGVGAQGREIQQVAAQSALQLARELPHRVPETSRKRADFGIEGVERIALLGPSQTPLLCMLQGDPAGGLRDASPHAIGTLVHLHLDDLDLRALRQLGQEGRLAQGGGIADHGLARDHTVPADRVFRRAACEEISQRLFQNLALLRHAHARALSLSAGLRRALPSALLLRQAGVDRPVGRGASREAWSAVLPRHIAEPPSLGTTVQRAGGA